MPVSRSFVQYVMKHRIHSGEKQFACPDCDGQFNQISESNDHCLFHTSNKLITDDKKTLI